MPLFIIVIASSKHFIILTSPFLILRVWKFEDIHYGELCREFRQFEKEENFEGMKRIKTLLDNVDLERSRGAQIRSRALILDENENPSIKSHFYDKDENSKDLILSNAEQLLSCHNY